MALAHIVANINNCSCTYANYCYNNSMVIQSSDAKSLKRWRIVLAILLVVIVGLVATIIIINLTKDSDGPDETDKQQFSFGVFMMNMDDTARGLYEKDPDNIQAIVDIYNKSFRQMIDMEDYSFAYVVLQEEYAYLNEINAPAATILGALLDIVDTDDFAFFGYVSQYNICHRIIEVAKKAENAEAIEKYQPYLEEAQPFYEKHINEAATDKTEEYEKESQNADSGEGYEN